MCGSGSSGMLARFEARNCLGWDMLGFMLAPPDP